MHPQLREIEEELEGALSRVEALAVRHSEEEWRARPPAGGWSAGECIAHLNMTSAAYLPLLDDALGRARTIPGGTPRRLRRDPIGWLIWKSVSPSGRMKVSTIPSFVPHGTHRKDELVAEFTRLQHGILERLRGSDGLAIQKVRLGSPFSERARYSLYSAFAIVAAHEHRHLGQAERAAGSNSG